MDSDLSGFYKLPIEERLSIIKKSAGLNDEEINLLTKTGALDLKMANRMIENVIGTTQLPLGIATNFRINGRDMLIPMAIEEPSVVAASSHAAKLCRPGGFKTSSDDPLMIGQIQLVGIDSKNMHTVEKKIQKERYTILDIANKKDSMMVKLGGGAKDIETKILNTNRGTMLIVHLIVDVRDAMGANCVNTMCETISAYLEEITGATPRLRIISNLAVKRLARADTLWKKDVIGLDVINGILDAHAFAESDPFRCATHNKGVMNGIDGVLIATGNDFRAVEAGAHCYASYSGRYQPLTKFWKTKSGDLGGSIELPVAVGLVGGATKTHPIAQIAVKILGVKNAKDLAEVVACVGLANNFAALRAMILEGIQKGHMKLHAKNIAVMARATGREIDVVAKKLAENGDISVGKAAEILGQIKNR